MSRHRVSYTDVDSYVTRDESLIRELMHPDHHAVVRQSLAEATVPAGITTRKHFHRQSEELYHIVAGQGLMILAEEQFKVEVGDTVCIPPGTRHCIRNTGEQDLKILCSCSPAYSHDDTVLVDD